MLKKKLEEYITAEAADSLLYEALAMHAKTSASRQIFMELAKDEAEHAKMFNAVYKQHFHNEYVPQLPKIEINENDFAEILRDRVLDESGDYRKYFTDAEQPESEVLRKIYRKASVDENVHALRLLDILGGL